jgi:hypothetical protein
MVGSAAMAEMVQSFTIVGFLFALAFPIGGTAAAIYVGLRTRTRLQLLAATPTSNVATARDGQRAFEGRAEALEGMTLAAPLTGAACCWYSARLERWEKGRESGGWRTVREHTSDEPFLIRDATGACVVLPLRAEVTATDHSVWQGKEPVPADTNPVRFGPGESAPLGDATIGNAYRYTEARIYPGDSLLVLGDFTTDPWRSPEELGEEAASGEAGEPEEEGAPTGVSDPRADWFDPVRLDAFYDRAERLTPRRIGSLSDRPFLLSTTPRARLLEAQGRAWKAAIGVALVPFAIAALLVWLRFA